MRNMVLKSNGKRSFGKAGEQIAADFLRKKGYKIIEQNFRFGKLGEIDIISLENEYICFIEVKTRTGTAFGLPCESVNKRKQRNIIKLAQIYLKENNLTEKNVRFDVVEVIAETIKGSISVKDINLIRNAF